MKRLLCLLCGCDPTTLKYPPGPRRWECSRCGSITEEALNATPEHEEAK